MRRFRPSHSCCGRGRPSHNVVSGTHSPTARMRSSRCRRPGHALDAAPRLISPTAVPHRARTVTRVPAMPWRVRAITHERARRASAPGCRGPSADDAVRFDPSCRARSHRRPITRHSALIRGPQLRRRSDRVIPPSLSRCSTAPTRARPRRLLPTLNRLGRGKSLAGQRFTAVGYGGRPRDQAERSECIIFFHRRRSPLRDAELQHGHEDLAEARHESAKAQRGPLLRRFRRTPLPGDGGRDGSPGTVVGSRFATPPAGSSTRLPVATPGASARHACITARRFRDSDALSTR